MLFDILLLFNDITVITSDCGRKVTSEILLCCKDKVLKAVSFETAFGTMVRLSLFNCRTLKVLAAWDKAVSGRGETMLSDILSSVRLENV